MAGEHEDKQSAIAGPIRKFGFVVVWALQLAAVPAASAQVVPDPPQSLTAANHPSTTFIKVTLTWGTPDNTGDSSITEVCYRYRRRVPASGGTAAYWTRYSTSTCVSVSDLGGVNRVDTGNLQSGNLHEFNVALRNDAGLSKWAVVFFTPGFSPTLAVKPSSVAENAAATTVTVTATLGNQVSLSRAVPVTVSVGGGTATAETDYTAVDDFTVTVPAGSLSGMGTFTLTPTDDDVDEGDETIEISGTATDFVNIAGAKLTITDDDTRGLKLSKTAVTVTEAAGTGRTATYTVALESQPTAAVSVSVSSGDENAATVEPATLSFTTANWKQGKTVTVTGVDDQVDNTPDRTATISHSASGGDYASVSKDLTVTITDDDTAPSGITLTVDADTGTAGVQGSVTENGGAKTVRVTATVNGTTRYPDAKTVTVAVGDTGDTATEGTDYGTVSDLTLTISAGAASASQTFTLTPTNDALVEGNEKISVDGTSSGITVTGAEITITDDDTAPSGITLTFSVADASVTEGDSGTASLTFTVTLSPGADMTTTVDWTTSKESGDTATPGTDYTAGSGTLTFAAGETSKTVTVKVTGDEIDEDNETLTVILSNATGGAGLGTAKTATGTITDDDTASTTITLSAQPASVTENTQAITVKVTATLGGSTTLAMATTVSVTVGGGSATPGTDYKAVSDFIVTIPAGELSGEAPCPLEPIDDTIVEGDEMIDMSGTAQGFTVNKAQVIVTDNDTVPNGRNRVVWTLLPEAARATVGSAMDAVSGRMEASSSGETAARLRLAGQEVRTAMENEALAFADSACAAEDGLRGLGTACEARELDLAQVLAGSAFVLPLSGGGEAGAFSPVLWGAGDWRSLSGGSVPEVKDSTVDWDGGVLSFHAGVDARLGGVLLAGVALSHSRALFDWTDQGGDTAVRGTYESRMTSLMPYLDWRAGERLNVWAATGYGRGEVLLDDREAGKHTSDAVSWSAGAGARGALLAGGRTALDLKGEAWLTRWEADASGPVAEEEAGVRRLRLALEGSHAWTFASEATLAPSLELGVRHDGGDGETGTGLELGGGVRWSDPALGLTLEGSGRAFLRRGGYREWGGGGLVRLDPGASGRGLSLTLAPAIGATSSGMARLWAEGGAKLPANADVPRLRLEAEVGYGLWAFGVRGVSTPYAGLSLAGDGGRTWRAGVRHVVGPAFDASLETTLRESVNDEDAPGHGVALHMRLRF